MAQAAIAIGVNGRDGVWRTLGTVTVDDDEDFYEAFAQAFEEVAARIRSGNQTLVRLADSDG